MDTSPGGTARRTRRAGVIAGLLFAAVTLAGCSASNDDSAANDQPAVADAAGESAADAGSGGAAGSVSVGDRAIVITGSLYVTVDDPLDAADRAGDIVTGAGGRVDARNETAPRDDDGGSAWMSLRIPATKLDGVVEKLSALGEVESYTTDSYDVTTEVIDLDAQISTLRASTSRIQALLDEAKSIPDIITLEDELASRQATLQSLEAQQRGLDDQVSMSTIELSLTTEPAAPPEESRSTFLDGLSTSWNAMVGSFLVALVVLGALLPWAVVGTLITFGVIALNRRRRAHRARRAPQYPQAAFGQGPVFGQQAGFAGTGSAPQAGPSGAPVAAPSAPQLAQAASEGNSAPPAKGSAAAPDSPSGPGAGKADAGSKDGPTT